MTSNFKFLIKARLNLCLTKGVANILKLTRMKNPLQKTLTGKAIFCHFTDEQTQYGYL